MKEGRREGGKGRGGVVSEGEKEGIQEGRNSGGKEGRKEKEERMKINVSSLYNDDVMNCIIMIYVTTVPSASISFFKLN